MSVDQSLGKSVSQRILTSNLTFPLRGKRLPDRLIDFYYLNGVICSYWPFTMSGASIPIHCSSIVA